MLYERTLKYLKQMFKMNISFSHMFNMWGTVAELWWNITGVWYNLKAFIRKLLNLLNGGTSYGC